MNQHNTKCFSLAFLILALTLATSNTHAEVSISDIRSRVNIGDEGLVDIDKPLAKTEKWVIGDFDPRWIELSGEILDTQPETLILDVYVKIKIGEISASRRGADVSTKKNTAGWQKEKLVASKELTFTSTTKKNFQHKFDIDALFGSLASSQKWPYILSFKFVVHDAKSVKKALAYKNIILEPDNSSY